MRKSNLIRVAGGFLLATWFAWEVGDLSQSTASAGDLPHRFILDNARDGDLVFRRGIDLTSRSLLALTEETSYTHVGLVIREGGPPRVIHIVPAGTQDGAGFAQEELLDAFIGARNADRAGLYRLAAEVPDRERIRTLAVRKGREYVEARVPFDEEFDMEHAGRFYCTELVWRAFLAAGLDLSPDPVELNLPIASKRFVLPSSLYGSRHLVPVVASPSPMARPVA